VEGGALKIPLAALKAEGGQQTPHTCITIVAVDG
jgi:hypothetical protein